MDLFVNEMHSSHFLPLIRQPTRFDPAGNNRPSLLDHIWFDRLVPHKTGILLFDLTDHLPTFMCIPMVLNRGLNNIVKISFRCFNDENKQKFNDLLQNFNWEVIRSEDPNLWVENFEIKMKEFYSQAFPVKSKIVSQKNYNNPWVNNRLRQLIKIKSTYFNWLTLGIVKNTKIMRSRKESMQFYSKLWQRW